MRSGWSREWSRVVFMGTFLVHHWQGHEIFSLRFGDLHEREKGAGRHVANMTERRCVLELLVSNSTGALFSQIDLSTVSVNVPRCSPVRASPEDQRTYFTVITQYDLLAPPKPNTLLDPPPTKQTAIHRAPCIRYSSHPKHVRIKFHTRHPHPYAHNVGGRNSDRAPPLAGDGVARWRSQSARTLQSSTTRPSADWKCAALRSGTISGITQCTLCRSTVKARRARRNIRSLSPHKYASVNSKHKYVVGGEGVGKARALVM